MWLWIIILFTFALAYAVYYCCFKPYNYWKNRGIVYEIPLPFVGNFGDVIFKRKHASEVYDYLYRKYSNERYVGIYVFTKPALLVRDLDLIKNICVDEFDHFSDRVNIFDKNFDKVIGNSLFHHRGKEWKNSKTILSSAIDALDIEFVFNSMSACAENFSNYFVKQEKELLEIQLNDVFSRYDSDVTSRISFGVNTDSLQDKDNEYFSAYKELKRFGAYEKLKLCLTQHCPFLAKVLQLKVFPATKTDFYKKIVAEYNVDSESTDKHFLSCLINAKNETLKKGKTKESKHEGHDVKHESESLDSLYQKWDEDEMTAHALMFLNSPSSFLAYELALNPSVQVKLQEEIDNVENSGKVTYETVSQMKFLDCVVSESLRKWPPLYQVDRECVKNFFEVDLSIPGEEKIVIEKNTAVIVPVMAIHRDPSYFPMAEKFSPERFNEENRSKIIPGSYIPFGLGPRNCLGSKLAILEVKLLFFHLLSKFDLVPTQNTKIRVEVGPGRYDYNGVTKTFLGLKPRKVTSL